MSRRRPMWRRYLTFWGRDLDRDLRDEVEFHLEARARELIDAGSSPEAAREEARRAFGALDPILAECRLIDERSDRARRLGAYRDELIQDVRFALRQLRRQPKLWAVTVLTLIVGIAASTSLFAVVDGVLLKPLPYPQPDRLVHVMRSTWKGVFVHLGERATTMDLAAFRAGPEITLGTGSEPVRLQAATVSPSLFDALATPAALGRTLTAEDARPGSPSVTVLSHGAWLTYFEGRRTLIGASVTVDGVPHTVVGVMPPEFDFPSRDTALWLPMTIDRASTASLWGGNGWTIIGRLRRGHDVREAREETRSLVPTFGEMFPFYLQMPDGYGTDAAVVTLRDEIVGGVRTELLVLLAAVGAVLLILCVNVANLLLARGVSRSRELATRAALGAGRGRLLRQLIVESLTVAVLSGGLGTLASIASLRALTAVLPPDLPRLEQVHLDARVLLFALGIATAIGLLVGLVPAIRATGAGQGLLAAGARGAAAGAGGGRLAGALAALELAFAVVLAVSAALLLRTLWNLTSVDAGFRVQGLVSARIAPSGSPDGLTADLLDRLSHAPGVTSAAVGTSVPFDDDAFLIGFGIEGRPGDPNLPTVADVGVGVTTGYLRTLGIPLLTGRGFADTDGADGLPVALVSQSLARAYWNGASPVGARIRLPERDAPWRTVVGVVGDVKWSSLAGRDPRVLYLPLAQHDAFTDLRRVVIRTTDDPSALATNLRGVVRALDENAAVSEIRTSRRRIGDSIARPRFAAYLLGGFAVVALLLAAIGVYGVLSYAMSRRIPEIGVRMAFGASPRDVFSLLFGEGLRLTLAGVGLGVPATVGATRFLSSLLFGVDPLDLEVLAAVVGSLVAVGLAVSYLPARRAARVDPMIALRQE